MSSVTEFASDVFSTSQPRRGRWHARHQAVGPGGRLGPGGVVELRVLGPLVVRRAGNVVALGRMRQRSVLGVLAVSPDGRASQEALIEALWGQEPPTTAVTMIQTYVSRLRRALGTPPGAPGGALVTTVNGYQLGAGKWALDLVEFTRLAEEAAAARRGGDLMAAAGWYGRALTLWRGEPLADLEVLREHPPVVALRRRWAQVVAEFGEVCLGSGRAGLALPYLQDLAERDPLDERGCAWLMLALAACGQQAAALAAYERMRRRLDAELGVRPGAELAEAHHQVLTQHLPVTAGKTAASKAAANGAAAEAVAQDAAGGQAGLGARPMLVGCQLPPVITDFTGRHREATVLAELVTLGAGGAGVPVALVSGLPGAGKTCLAVKVAHELAASFPDGQLWIPLDGASASPRDPGEVLGELLRMLGVSGSALPITTPARAGLYRSLLAGRRVLVVADDAASAAQAEPLLPGTTGAAVIITSRSALAALSGARLLPLGPFALAEATELLARIAGRHRVFAEPQAAAELAGNCGLLPLAVRIAGAKLAARPSWPVSVLAGKLAAELRRLDELETGGMSVRASVAASYQALTQRQRRAFCLLGMLGPVEVAEWVVAALLGEPDSADVVAELTDRSLLTPTGVDATGQPRYRLHDLLRDFATARLASEDHPAAQARDRVLQAWLQLATLAATRLPREPYFPRHPDEPLPGPVPQPTAESLTQNAVGWFGAERLNLLTAADLACHTGNYHLAERLARALAGFHYLHSRHDDAQRIWTTIHAAAQTVGDTPTATHARLRLIAVTCTRGEHAQVLPWIGECVRRLERYGDLTGLTTALYWQAVCDINLGAFADAQNHAGQAVDIARQTGNRHAEFMALRMLGMAQVRQPHLADKGAANCEHALSLAKAAGDPVCQREILHTVAHVYNGVGRYADAINLCQQGLAQDERLGYTDGHAYWLGVLADAYHRLGRDQEAADTLRRALSVFRRNFTRRHQALCLLKLGYAHQAMGDFAAAIRYLKESLPIFSELQLPHYQQRAHQALKLCENGQFSDLSEPPSAVAGNSSNSLQR